MIYNFRLDLDSAREMIILVGEKEKSWMTSAKAWESNLVMYRMEDTERIRTKLRENRRRAVREKEEMEEHKEKSQME